MNRAVTHVCRASAFLVVGLLLASAHPATAQTCVPPPSGLVAWWPGDGNTNDIVGGRHGLLVGSATFATGMVGDGAFSFDGSGWVEVADDPIWTLGTKDFTIELWVRFNNLSGRDPFISHDDGTNPKTEDNKWIFWYDVTGHDQLRGIPALRMHINRFPHGPSRDLAAAPWSAAVDLWYHVAVTKANNRYRLYRAGEEVASDVLGIPIPDPVVPLMIGKAEDFKLDGLIDEVAIFDRALDATDIRAIYEAGAAGKCKELSPVASP